MKTWLHSKQYIRITRDNEIAFQHIGNDGYPYGVTLTINQFKEFDDFLYHLKNFNRLKRLPLGRNVWLYYNKPIIKLCVCSYDNSMKQFFRFYRDSWYKYISNVHDEICSFLQYRSTRKPLKRNGFRNSELYETNEPRVYFKSRRYPSNISQNKVLSRSSRDVSDENEERKKSPNVSKRKSSNIGTHFSFKDTCNALRINSKIADDYEDGECMDEGSDIEEYGDSCEIE